VPPDLPVITYTLTVVNSGPFTVTNLTITDTVPAGSQYLPGSGGTLVGDVVSWTVPSLEPSGGVTQTTFAVSATETLIVNDDYRVEADDGYTATGTIAVQTVISAVRNYLPIIHKAP
jgi:uncharacterized repeat protein (TIGR01451 family)